MISQALVTKQTLIIIKCKDSFPPYMNIQLQYLQMKKYNKYPVFNNNRLNMLSQFFSLYNYRLIKVELQLKVFLSSTATTQQLCKMRRRTF